MPHSVRFVMMTCQVGAENALKAEMALRWPEYRFAYSRPGFLTFKLPDDVSGGMDADAEPIFARTWCYSLGKATQASAEERADEAWRLLGNRPVQRVHVWTRDLVPVGERGFDPRITPEAESVRRLLLARAPAELGLGGDASPKAHKGDAVLDCILVEPDEWWVGWHRAQTLVSRQPGGMFALTLPAEAVSRAWLKMEEALRWADLPIPPLARFAEIGSAPGGASQALLARGYSVLGVDPAEMDQAVLAHPQFTHLRRRANQAPRRSFRKVRWLTADMNVAPDYTLEVVESIVTHAEANVRGMLLTLKLFDWSMVDSLPEYLHRIRSWGFNEVRARQLQHNRQEICVAALQQPFQRKMPRRG